LQPASGATAALAALADRENVRVGAPVANFDTPCGPTPATGFDSLVTPTGPGSVRSEAPAAA
jgi:hypothetical protein